MEDEITVETSPDGAGTDDIPCGQASVHDEQAAITPHAAEPSSPATNMAANKEPQPIPPVVKGKANAPKKKNTIPCPRTTGINYQIYNPLGIWPPQNFQLPSYPCSPMAAGPSWAMPPPAPSFYGGAVPFAPPPNAPLFTGLVPMS